MKIYIVLSGVCAVPLFCSAHDQPVHEAIAQSAFLSSTSPNQFLNNITVNPNATLFFDPHDFAAGSFTPIYWLTNGAFHEDDPYRFGDHFYTLTPTRTLGQAKGLTDWHESLIVPGSTTNSYAWGTVPGLPSPFLLGNPPTPTNTETWECGRAYELAGLTNALQPDRDSYLAHMFYTLGHILHLNQDLSQPDHVRNDEHLISWHRYIENFGSKTYRYEQNAFPLEPHGWTYWQSEGFSKVLDFWDRGLYANNSSQGLKDDANGVNGKKLGLAEFSNGNFIGEDAIYSEYFSSGNIHYFPFPSLKDTTQPQIQPGLSGTVIDSVTLANGKSGDVVYLSKTNGGINVTHHSALHYFAVLHTPRINAPSMKVQLTINDPNVLQEYHSILIPKAIEYSTGILDYFFRGTMSIQISGISSDNPEQATNVIINTSSQPFSGGTFHLFYDDTNGVRTEITDFSSDYSGSLATNDSFTIIFSPVADAAKYLLVYQGSIGTTDPVDSGIAIAAQTFIGPSYWHNSFESDSGNLSPQAGDVFCGGWHVDAGDVDVGANGTWGENHEGTAYEGDYLLDLDGDQPGTISTNIPTTAGKTYQLTFVWCRNPDSITGALGQPVHIPSAQVLINGNAVMSLVGNMNNSWANLDWQPATYAFTAASSSTTLTFKSTTAGTTFSGIQLDAMDLQEAF
ncbi:MAG TPA: DUF642 domain-containing protein [Verrucomicrobiae bacterium]|nr:DUF642 domain-containing protein [Verrucomicrobiae bacterium]